MGLITVIAVFAAVILVFQFLCYVVHIRRQK